MATSTMRWTVVLVAALACVLLSSVSAEQDAALAEAKNARHLTTFFACGGPHQKHCVDGDKCQPGLEPNAHGICIPCGKEHQFCCKFGPEKCHGWGTECNPHGLCLPCGGPHQNHCVDGKKCQPGLEPNAHGICIPCGKEHQFCCKFGPEKCHGWGTECNPHGLCLPCGGPHQIHCVDGKKCQLGLEPNAHGICIPCGGPHKKGCVYGQKCMHGLYLDAHGICARRG